MANKKRVTFTLNDDDKLDKEIRDCFKRTAGNFHYPVGKLMSRAFYLACLELNGEIEMKAMLNMCRNFPLDANQPLDETLLTDSQTWRDQAPVIEYMKKWRALHL